MSKFLITLSNLLAFAAYASFCIVFLLFFFWGALITSNYSFCLIFLFSLRLLLYAAVCCVCVFLCTVLLFTVSCLLGQFHVFLFVIICFLLLGSECKNRKRPLNVFLIQMICFFCTRFACCFVSNYSFLLTSSCFIFLLLRFAAHVVLLIFRADIFVIFIFS